MHSLADWLCVCPCLFPHRPCLFALIVRVCLPSSSVSFPSSSVSVCPHRPCLFALIVIVRVCLPSSSVSVCPHRPCLFLHRPCLFALIVRRSRLFLFTVRRLCGVWADENRDLWLLKSTVLLAACSVRQALIKVHPPRDRLLLNRASSLACCLMTFVRPYVFRKGVF